MDIFKLYEQIYKEEYTMECLEYLDKEPKEVPANKQINLECIVQNGFYIIFLVQYYVSENKNDYLDNFRKKKLSKLFKNNEFYQKSINGFHCFLFNFPFTAALRS